MERWRGGWYTMMGPPYTGGEGEGWGKGAT